MKTKRNTFARVNVFIKINENNDVLRNIQCNNDVSEIIAKKENPLNVLSETLLQTADEFSPPEV